MAKILRYTGDLKAFGSTATGTERTVFGDTTQSDILNDNLNTNYFRGWGINGVNDSPKKQDFNAFAFTASQIISYMHQMGVPEWDSLQEYPTVGASCTYEGTTWRRGSAWTVGDEPGVSANWIITDETIISRSAIADSVVGTSENAAGNLTVTIPTYWNSWVMDTSAAGWVDETGSATGVTNLTIRIREDSGTSGTVLTQAITDLGGTGPDIREPFSLIAFQEAITATGDKTYSLTTTVDGGSGNFSIRDTKWILTARRVS